MKKIFLRFLSVLLAFQGYAAFQFLNIEQAYASNYEVPDVIINEVMWMGSTEGTGDEWIELFNTTDGDIDISDWVLTNVKTSNDDFTIPTSTIISAGNYLLVGQAGLASTIRSLVDAPLDIEVTGFALSDPSNCGNITLEDDLAVVVDSMGCNLDGSYFEGEKDPKKRSMERDVVVEDGLLESSWHTSVGFANLDLSTSPDNFGTPGFVNDETAPAVGTVNDGDSDDIDWSADTTSASVNWSGFDDVESGLTGDYEVELLNSADTVIDSATVTGESHTFSSFALSNGESYRFSVKATNNVGLESLAAESNGFTLDTDDPDPVTSLSATDVLNDNGGSVFVEWVASLSQDEIVYEVSYEKVGSGVIDTLVPIVETEVTIDGLENEVDYEFTVVAIDFNSQRSNGESYITQAKDNLAPELDVSKVVLTQNKPGTSDTIAGIAGASNEVATLTIFDRSPSEPAKITIASLQVNNDFSFDSQILGDNLYDSVWLQLIDDAGNYSDPVEFKNDIVAPDAPTITKAVATCRTHSCRVVLNWKDNGPDSKYYQVTYSTKFDIKKSLPVSGTSLILDLPSNGSIKNFSVQAFDKFGNASDASNKFLASMVSGVVTSAKLVNGKLSVVTYAVEGSKETVKATIETSPAKLVPAAHAAEDDVDEDIQVAGDQDWIRISVVVILLLVIAGGFYALSKTMQNSELDIPEVPKKKVKSGNSNKTNKKKKRTKRKKP